MARYDLNAILKARQAAATQTTDEEIHLDDVSRVKVLSPGRQVFKRFIRNRLAVFGSVLLIAMFVFSFLGPLAYPYGQKQIFYKYDAQNVNYAMAKENTAYNGYVIDPSVNVERPVVNAMNSNIKKMAEVGEDEMIVAGENGTYVIRRLADDVYTLSTAPLTQVAVIGQGTVKVGVYSSISKQIEYEVGIEDVAGLAEAAAENARGSSGEFTFDGVNYTFEKGVAKSFTLYKSLDGVQYVGRPLDAGFESAVTAAAETGASFSSGGKNYGLVRHNSLYDVYEIGEESLVRVFTRLLVDTMIAGTAVSEEFRVGALLQAENGGSFTAGDSDYTVERDGETLVIRDSAGGEYAELTPFSVRRYNGDDSMEYGLKKAIAEKVEEMISRGEKSGSIMYNLPQQTDTGEYTYDEDGNLIYSNTEMVITQRDTGEYVINCDQVIYVIDMFAPPSLTHLLGTDGDGFDVLARIMYGGRVSLMVGFVVVFLEIFLGVIMGGLAGYYGKWVDNIIMRLVDIFYCLPSLPIMIILGAMMDALRMDTYIRLLIMMAALGIMGWAGVARLVRGQILSLREQEFMVATEATGIRVKDRIFHHLVPNVMPLLIVNATMGMGGVILTESTLSFLGLGVKHPLATWGTIINSVSSASAMAHYAFIWIPVGLLICLTVIAFNFVGDGLRDAYDPKSKR